MQLSSAMQAHGNGHSGCLPLPHLALLYVVLRRVASQLTLALPRRLLLLCPAEASQSIGSQIGGTQEKCKVCTKTVYPLEKVSARALVHALRLSVEALAPETAWAAPESLGMSCPRCCNHKRSCWHAVYSVRWCLWLWLLVCGIVQVSVENQTYHKTCFKCIHSGCKLTTATYRAYQGKLYCKHHFTQLFMSKGNYSEFAENGNGAGAATSSAPAASADASATADASAPAAAAPAAASAPAPAAASETGEGRR